MEWSGFPHPLLDLFWSPQGFAKIKSTGPLRRTVVDCAEADRSRLLRNLRRRKRSVEACSGKARWASALNPFLAGPARARRELRCRLSFHHLLEKSLQGASIKWLSQYSEIWRSCLRSIAVPRRENHWQVRVKRLDLTREANAVH